MGAGGGAAPRRAARGGGGAAITDNRPAEGRAHARFLRGREKGQGRLGLCDHPLVALGLDPPHGLAWFAAEAVEFVSGKPGLMYLSPLRSWNCLTRQRF